MHRIYILLLELIVLALSYNQTFTIHMNFIFFVSIRIFFCNFINLILHFWFGGAIMITNQDVLNVSEGAYLGI